MNIAQYFPLTKAFKARVELLAKQKAASAPSPITLLRDLGSEKIILQNHAKHQAHRLAVAEIRADKLVDFGACVSVGLVVGGVVALFQTSWLDIPSFAGGVSLLRLIAGLFCAIMLFFVALGPIMYAISVQLEVGRFSKICITTGWPVAVICFTGYHVLPFPERLSTLSIWQFSLFLAWILNAAICLLLAVLSVMAISTFGFSVYITQRRSPDALIIEDLGILIRDLQTGVPLTLTARHRLLARLETLAIRFQRDMFRYYVTGDPTTEVWVKEELEKMAAALREIKRKLAFASVSTVGDIADELRMLLHSALRTDWSAFPRSELPRLSRRQKWLRVLHFVRACLVAALPLLLMYLLQSLEFVVEEKLTAYITIGAYLWAVVSLLFMLDPVMNTKVTTLREALGSVTKLTSGKSE